MIAFLLVLQTAAQESPWSGFEPGTWVTLTWTESKGGERREKVVVNEARRLEIWVFEKDEYKKQPGEVQHSPGVPPDRGVQETASRSEEVDIGGKKIAATVREYEFEDRSISVKVRGVVTTSKDVRIPYREFQKEGADIALGSDVLAMEFTITKGDVTNVYRLKVVQLQEELTIGGKKVPCVVEELSGEETVNQKKYVFSGKRWLADGVPGRLAKLEAEITVDGSTIKRAGVVTDFEVK